MENRLIQLQELISKIEGVTMEYPLSLDNNYNAIGRVKIALENGTEFLKFDIKILPEYPMKRYNSEAIIFSNINLIQYGHVMGDGSICINTSHNINLSKKLQIDFNSLQSWIRKYYLKKGKDSIYEHIILTPTTFKNNFYSFMYTDVDNAFGGNEFGEFEYSKLQEGTYENKVVRNFIIHSFKSNKNISPLHCKWSKSIDGKLQNSKNIGLFVYIEKPPATYEKFAFTDWSDLQNYVSQEFFLFLYNSQKVNSKLISQPIPLMIGYKISDGKIHWQIAILEIGKFPINHYKENKNYFGHFESQEIIWGFSRNVSYENFFGRGSLNNKITQSKILIIGLGAIGSIIATTLVRSGCIKIDLIDFDVKEPENICRSEYSFITGIDNKVNELSNRLISISPFVELGIVDESFFNLFAKTLHNSSQHNSILKGELEKYDIIFDCSTDNDLMYILNQMKLNSLITISITNHAKHLVCATEPNSYNWVLNQIENVLYTEAEDLHYPTGCWSPTFKASYNDIQVLVQYAIKHINSRYEKKLMPLKNFILETEEENDFKLKLKEF